MTRHTLVIGLIGIFLTSFLFWFDGIYWIRQSAQNNLWSIHYLWQQGNHPLREQFPDLPHPSTHTNGYIWMARAQLNQGDSYKALQTLQPLAHSTNQDVQRIEAEIALYRGDYPAAIQTWVEIHAVDELLTFAQQMDRQERVDIATDAYVAAYAIADERTVLPFARFLYRTKGDFSAAEELLHEHIQGIPNSRYAISWLRELGAIYRQQQAWRNAQLIYQELVSIAPDSAEDWVELGWVYYEQGAGVEKALQQFQRAIAAAPHAGVGYYATAFLLNREERYAEADPWYQQALARRPEERSWWLSRAVAMQKAGDQTTALQLFTSMQQQFPDYAYGHYQAAQAYYEAKQQEPAIRAIESAIRQLDPQRDSAQTQATYYARAGRIYEWAGQVQEALAAYQKAHELNPNRQDVREGLQRLQ
ncbi:MAG: tetratricopeptide repeat protein [Caldilineaceae bacterium]|nr:tetratricopeptide repeat protein [Caldilineaceae bacterium]